MGGRSEIERDRETEIKITKTSGERGEKGGTRNEKREGVIERMTCIEPVRTRRNNEP